MSVSQPTDLTLDKALKILKSYDCAQVTNTELLIEPEQLRNSLLLVTSLASSQNLGICADNFQQGFSALASYLEAFGYQHARGISSGNPSISAHQSNLELENISQSSEPVYLKFSTQKMSYYSDKYTGEYRGVLVSCQSEDDLIAGTYGHFPLDLFMND
ncbi:MAG: DUF1824 family protein [Pleurocapsa sp. MO_192.B19]|nr:DUF1824 family protein [Pleurocapsa sp. MO_192.B19]